MEELILPCFTDIIKNLIGPSEIENLKHVSLSNSTVGRRIEEMSENMLSLVVSKIQNTTLTSLRFRWTKQQISQVQLNFASMLDTYMMGICKTSFCFVKRLAPEQRQWKYLTMQIFFDKHGLKWQNALGVFTDGAPAMFGCRSGFQNLVKALVQTV